MWMCLLETKPSQHFVFCCQRGKETVEVNQHVVKGNTHFARQFGVVAEDALCEILVRFHRLLARFLVQTPSSRQVGQEGEQRLAVAPAPAFRKAFQRGVSLRLHVPVFVVEGALQKTLSPPPPRESGWRPRPSVASGVACRH